MIDWGGGRGKRMHSQGVVVKDKREEKPLEISSNDMQTATQKK